MTDGLGVVYRYKQQRYAPSTDEWDRLCGEGRLVLLCTEFRIIKRTPKGVWIDDYVRKRFINLEARRKFACANKADALASFIARKNRHIAILNAQLNDATLARGLAAAELKAL